jgi:hypothetical protein
MSEHYNDCPLSLDPKMHGEEACQCDILAVVNMENGPEKIGAYLDYLMEMGVEIGRRSLHDMDGRPVCFFGHVGADLLGLTYPLSPEEYNRLSSTGLLTTTAIGKMAFGLTVKEVVALINCNDQGGTPAIRRWVMKTSEKGEVYE